MSSNYSKIKCEKCGGVESVEINCQTFEEYHFCLRCGRVKNHVLVREKITGKPILDEKGALQYVIRELPGYGCVMLARKSGYNALYPLEEPFNERHLSNYKNAFADTTLIPEESYITRWDESSGKVVMVEGSMPMDYEEYAKIHGYAD